MKYHTPERLALKVLFRKNMITLILLVFGFVLFCLAGLGIPSPSRFNLIGFGLACCALAEILSRAPAFR